MRIPLEVQLETAEKLRQLAKDRHLSIEELLSIHIPGLAPIKPDQNSTDYERALEEWITSFPTDTPPLSSDSITRASIYRDR